MKKRNIFPVRYYAIDMGTWVDSPKLALDVWTRTRVDIARHPKKITWYATDLEVLTPTSIRLFVYGMADSLYGGIGKKIYEEVITDFTKDEKAFLDEMVLGIYTTAAEEELQRREDDRRERKILSIRKELFNM